MDLKLVSRYRFVAYKTKYSMNVITGQDVEINYVKNIYSLLEQIVRKNIIVKASGLDMRVQVSKKIQNSLILRVKVI